MTRPVFYRPDPARVAWCDPATGVIVTDAGRMLAARPGPGRRRINPADLADVLAAAGITRAYLTGGPWPASWATFTDPARSGWVPGKRGHYEDTADPRLDLARDTPAGPQRVDLRRASSWGLPDDVTPTDARGAFLALDAALRARFRNAAAGPILRATATATGQQLHALAAPSEWDGAQLDDDTADLIRATSPQHRIETPGTCYGSCDAHQARPDASAVVTYLDARFTYASLTAGLGVAPARRLTGAESDALLVEHPHARARFLVRATVPEWWEHPGLLMARHDDGRHWHAPDLPGHTFETWADACEVVPARAHGWDVRLVEGIAFTEGARPLDTWTRRLVDVHKGATEANTRAGELAARMVRTITLRTIGGFHSTGRDVTHIADVPLDVPSTGVTYRRDLPDGRVVYRVRQAPRGAQAAHARPDLTSQIWARAHARLYVAPGGAGFLSLPPDAVWGMWGDALYLATGDPGWPDDGRPGRYRVKGTTPEPVTRPRGAAALLDLRNAIGE